MDGSFTPSVPVELPHGNVVRLVKVKLEQAANYSTEVTLQQLGFDVLPSPVAEAKPDAGATSVGAA